MKRKVAAAMAAVMLCSVPYLTVYSESVNRLAAAPAGMAENSPAENVFGVDGTEREFVILDNDNGENEFFIIAKDIYGNKQYDPNNTQKFDVNDPNNIASWLNGDFLMSGNDGMALPSELTKYINYEHEWKTEAGFASGNCPKDYTFKAGLALMSQTEYVKYAGCFGIRDNSSSTGWWLRTGRGLQGAAGLVLRVSLTTTPGSTAGWDANYAKGSGVKPVFYLKSAFFKNVRLNPDTMGDRVKELLKKYYARDEMRELYTMRELVDCIGYTPDITLEKTENGVSALNNLKSEKKLVIIAAAYNYLGKCTGFETAECTVESKSRRDVNMSAETENGGYVKYFAWTDDGTMDVISNTVTVVTD